MFRFSIVLVLASGCGLAALKQQNDATQAFVAQGQTAALAARANAHHEMFVIADRAWVCATEQAALAGPCPDGKELKKNRVVMVVGQAANAGVWPVAEFDRTGEHRLYTAAAALDELPDTKQLDAYADDVAKRFPDDKRIPLGAITFVDLLQQPEAYRGRFLVLRQRSIDMTNKDFKAGTFTFTIPIPVSTGSKWLALAQLELVNHELVDDFQNGGRSYECGPKYCDDFVIVAELTGRTVERYDELGIVHRLPVFAIRELGDRYGSYR
jgi:hypothetical protein